MSPSRVMLGCRSSGFFPKLIDTPTLWKPYGHGYQNKSSFPGYFGPFQKFCHPSYFAPLVEAVVSDVLYSSSARRLPALGPQV